MTSPAPEDIPVRLLGPDDGDLMGPPDGVMDRFMIGGEKTGQRFALVEHRLAPRALAAPVHLHTREDEFSFVLEGTVGAWIEGEVVTARQGDLLFKPRDEWHTFWNDSDQPARILEIISPAGLEALFRHLDSLSELPDPEALAELARPYGARVDFERTFPIVEAHQLSF